MTAIAVTRKKTSPSTIYPRWPHYNKFNRTNKHMHRKLCTPRLCHAYYGRRNRKTCQMVTPQFGVALHTAEGSAADVTVRGLIDELASSYAGKLHGFDVNGKCVGMVFGRWSDRRFRHSAAVLLGLQSRHYHFTHVKYTNATHARNSSDTMRQVSV